MMICNEKPNYKGRETDRRNDREGKPTDLLTSTFMILGYDHTQLYFPLNRLLSRDLKCKQNKK